jgi:MoxR-like ATPase
MVTEIAELSIADAAKKATQLRDSIGQSIFGQEELIAEALTCFIASGHLLLTGAPGLAKTTLVRVIAEQMGLQFGRVQFTPDLLPSDILGSDILNMDGASGKRSFDFAKGPVFTNLLLADEINRASPRTQSALLEAMQERIVTVGGKRHHLPQPFLVFATQNPFESEGTFPLPEAQLDRFLMFTIVDYPSSAAELQILEEHVRGKLFGEQIGDYHKTSNRLAPSDVQHIMAAAKSLPIEPVLIEAIGQLVRSTRPGDELCPDQLKKSLRYGAGPRAGIALISAARAYALLQGATEVRWSHIQRMAKPVLRHRIRLVAHAVREGMQDDGVIDMVLKRVVEANAKVNATAGKDASY